ncbi:peptidoglycan DD-metalloendopeptidase family protein, partial [Nesterenkonia halobia]|uniref:peptidoglycan DD-metalloendopeptidase family protein n=1 Tax=Nesterenkonia halobia TaxID=37922 RepID=UPI0031E00A5F
MPNKLSTAIVGSLAVGLTMPLNTVAAQAIPAAPSTPSTGDGSQRSAGDTATAAPGVLDGVALRTSREAGQFHRPLDAGSYRYTSEYGARCIPVQGGSTYHHGQDMGAEEGSQIRAVADGTVVRASSGTRYTSGYVVLRHQVDGETVHSAYYHMWDATTHVQVGQQVSGGQTVGLVGNSGPSTAPHLHVEIWEGDWLTGESQDPTQWLAQRGVSLKGDAGQVQNISTPGSCGYFTAQDTPLRSGASSTAPVIDQLSAGTEMTSVPGDMVNGMVRVTVDGQSGWVRHPHVTPSRPAGTDSSESAAASPGDGSASGHHLGQYLPGTRGLVEELASLLGQS